MPRQPNLPKTDAECRRELDQMDYEAKTHIPSSMETQRPQLKHLHRSPALRWTRKAPSLSEIDGIRE